jgi:hypothetical protein
VTNLGAADYQALLGSAAHTCRNIIEDALEGINADYIFYNPVTNISEGPLTEMKASDGQLIWQNNDPVHLSDTAYGDIGLALLDLWLHSEFTLRKRIDSIIVDHNLWGIFRGRGRRAGFRGGNPRRGRGRGQQYPDSGQYARAALQHILEVISNSNGI